MWERRRSTPGCSSGRTNRSPRSGGSGLCRWRLRSWCTDLEGGRDGHEEEMKISEEEDTIRERRQTEDGRNYSLASNWKKPEMMNLCPFSRVKSWATNTKIPRMENIQASTELACTAWRYSVGGARESHTMKTLMEHVCAWSCGIPGYELSSDVSVTQWYVTVRRPTCSWIYICFIYGSKVKVKRFWASP